MDARARRDMRRQLDRRFEKLAASDLIHGLRPPASGWIRAIRDALGMTAGDLARGMSVTSQRVGQIEKAEAEGALNIATLQAAAEALGCDLVYTLVPRGSLDKRVYQQAIKIARADVGAAGRHMILEDQGTDGATEAALVEARARELAHDMPRGFWRR